MKPEILYAMLKNSSLFRGFNERQLSEILGIAEVRKLEKDEVLIYEGESGAEIYLILDGVVEVLKHDDGSNTMHPVSVLHSGETLGEMSLINDSPRSATIRALKDLAILAIPFAKIRENQPLHSQLIFNISQKLSERLKKTSEVTVRSLQAELEGAQIRLEMGRFLFTMLVILSLWIFLVAIFKEMAVQLQNSSVVTTLMIALLVIASINHIRRSHFPISYFGFTLKNWQKTVFEAVLFTIPLLAIATGLKWLLIRYSPSFKGDELLSFKVINPASPVPISLQLALPILYVLLTPLQEFLARGVIQSSLRAALSWKHRAFWAVILSNLLFAAFHAHLSQVYSLMAFSGGLFWGWLYERQWSLLGASISHALIGAWFINILGFGDKMLNY